MSSKKKMVRAVVVEAGAMIDWANALVAASIAEQTASAAELRQRQDAYWAKEQVNGAQWRILGLELPVKPPVC